MNLHKVKIELEVTNADEIIAAAQRLGEIARELEVIAYTLSVKTNIKEEQPTAGTADCSK